MTDELIARAAAARRAVARFWEALRDDDDDALREVCAGVVWAAHGRSAAGVRDAFGLSREDIAHLGVTTGLRILTDGSWCFIALPAWRTLTLERGRMALAHPVTVRETGHGWLVTGQPAVPLDGCRYVEIPLAVVLPMPADASRAV